MTATVTPDALGHALRRLADRHDLSVVEAEDAVTVILSGGAGEAPIAAFLAALRVKGETADELAGAVAAVRGRMVPFEAEGDRSRWLDTCGTGGDGANTLNVSTATAIVVASCGVPVTKHGNRSASGNSGSAEVLAELGVVVEAGAEVLARCLVEVGITFLFAPAFHPGLRFAGPVRKSLPFRTVFNLVGPLANPARPGHQLVGVSGLREAGLVARALATLGTTRATVVCGHGGLDEVTLDGPTAAFLVAPGTVAQIEWVPSDFGLGPVAVDDLRVSGPADSARRITRLLAGEPGPARDVVLANAAAALARADPSLDLKAAVARAAEAVDSGRASRLLARWRDLSRTP